MMIYMLLSHQICRVSRLVLSQTRVKNMFYQSFIEMKPWNAFPMSSGVKIYLCVKFQRYRTKIHEDIIIFER